MEHPLAPDPTNEDDGFEHMKPSVVQRAKLCEADVTRDIAGVVRLVDARSYREAASLAS
jgi:hypothetical protein